MGCGSQKEKIKRYERPNIILIISDDHAYQAISAYQRNLIATPNIDRIAQQGMRFSNACVSNSICAPSRATILTGKHSHLNGKIDNRLPFDTTNITFPILFQQAGYQTGMFGKLHFGNNPKGIDDFMILPGQGNYINPDFEEEGSVYGTTDKKIILTTVGRVIFNTIWPDEIGFINMPVHIHQIDRPQSSSSSSIMAEI